MSLHVLTTRLTPCPVAHRPPTPTEAPPRRASPLLTRKTPHQSDPLPRQPSNSRAGRTGNESACRRAGLRPSESGFAPVVLEHEPTHGDGHERHDDRDEYSAYGRRHRSSPRSVDGASAVRDENRSSSGDAWAALAPCARMPTAKSSAAAALRQPQIVVAGASRCRALIEAHTRASSPTSDRDGCRSWSLTSKSSKSLCMTAYLVSIQAYACIPKSPQREGCRAAARISHSPN